MSNINDEFLGHETELHLTATAGGAVSAATLIGDVTDIDGLEIARKIAETNAFGRLMPKKKKGQYELGTFSFKFNWRPGDSIHEQLKDAVAYDGDHYLSVIFRDGAENARCDIQGKISKFKITPTLEDVVPGELEGSLSAVPVYDTTTDPAI